jgi:hypothetical protein
MPVHETNELLASSVPAREGTSMKVTTVDLDIAKQIFQVHGADAVGGPSYGGGCKGIKLLPSLRTCRSV